MDRGRPPSPWPHLLAELCVECTELLVHLSVVALGGGLQLGDGLRVVQVLLSIRYVAVVVVT